MTPTNSDRAARAEARRRSWIFGVAHGPEQAEEADLVFWLAATPAERIRGVTELIDEMRWMEGEDGPAPRLQRSVGGVRARGG